jgi:cellulose synthase (UDP-forming)
VTIVNPREETLRRSITIISLLVAMAVLFTAMPATARTKIALGISNPQANYVGVLENHKARYGRYPAMFSLWSSWGSRGQGVNQPAPVGTCTYGQGTCAFPRDAVDYLMDRNITPIIWWQYTNPEFPSQGAFSRYKIILNGTHNAYIRQWANELKLASQAHGNRPIGVRPFHEATGTWFPWSIGRFDNTVQNYKAAWRYLNLQFQQAGARKNARFIWSNYTPRKGSYPGDKYIDYVGFTVLNFGAQKKWRSMVSVTNDFVRRTKQFSKRPILITEVASHYRGGNKAAWLKLGYVNAYKRHPRVQGILYLDTNVPQLGQRHPDWRLIQPKNGSAVKAYRQLVNNPRFTGKLR